MASAPTVSTVFCSMEWEMSDIFFRSTEHRRRVEAELSAIPEVQIPSLEIHPTSDYWYIQVNPGKMMRLAWGRCDVAGGRGLKLFRPRCNDSPTLAKRITTAQQPTPYLHAGLGDLGIWSKFNSCLGTYLDLPCYSFDIESVAMYNA